jgi:hypothetical protein
VCDVKRARKRQRTQYVVLEWQPLLTETYVRGKPAVHCRTAVVSATGLHLAASGQPARIRLAQQARVHGWWLPAQFVIGSKHARFVVDVDLVRHMSAPAEARAWQRWQAARNLADLADLAEPATWVRLAVHNGNGCDVLNATLATDAYQFQVTQVTVLPPLVDARARTSVPRTVQVVVNDLLSVALEQAQLHGVVKPADLRSVNVARITAKVHAAGTTPKQRARPRVVRTSHNDVLVLQQVRRVHEATPQGDKVRAVMQHFGWGQRKAEAMVRASQLQLRWGKAYERSKSSRQHKTHKRGSKP